jgi:hypothetical protein
MKLVFKSILMLFLLFGVFGCASAPSHRFRISFDPSIEDPSVQTAWMSYAYVFINDMNIYYTKNPAGEYIVPYNVELTARNNLIEFYLRVKKEQEIHDSYIEDLIKIRSSNMLNEYVFFSFNPGNWTNDNNFREEQFTAWMNNNLPGHTPQTLASVSKVE